MKNVTKKRLINGSIIAALLAALAVFGVMLQTEKNLLTQYERGSIFVAAKRIPKGEMISAENYQEYFEAAMLDKNFIPESAVSSPEQIVDLVAVVGIDPGTLLTMGMFETLNEITEELKEPVIAGVKAEDLYQMVGGILRTGDRIHIYSVKEEQGTRLVWENVFVQGVFDQMGNAIDNADTITPVQRINVYLDKDEVAQFYTELATGSLRIVKAEG